MTYLPPFARMRAIRANNPPPLPNAAQEAYDALQASPNVEAALLQVPSPPNPPEPEPHAPPVPEPVVEVLPEPVVEVLPEAPEPELLPDEGVAEGFEPNLDDLDAVPEAVEEAPKELRFTPQMKKEDLLKIALGAGLAVSDQMTKQQILDALKAAV